MYKTLFKENIWAYRDEGTVLFTVLHNGELHILVCRVCGTFAFGSQGVVV